MEELWKPVPIEIYSDWYDVSNYGQARSWRNSHQNRRTTPLMLKPGIASGGYPRVVLYVHPHNYSATIHSLVANAFLGPCPEGMEVVRHFDGNPENNHVSNLRWGTYSENMYDQVRHGRKAKAHPASQGEKHHAAKLSDEDVEYIREHHVKGKNSKNKGNSAELAARFGVTRSHISDVASGRTRMYG